VKPAVTAVSRERLCKHLLLDNRLVTSNNEITGKQGSVRDPCDSYVEQQ
jgi:hypothetical protein